MAIDARTKDDVFRNPTMDRRHFGRHLSTCQVNGTAVMAIQEGIGQSTRILLLVQRHLGASSVIPNRRGNPSVADYPLTDPAS
jgi:hypothetical protein